MNSIEELQQPVRDGFEDWKQYGEVAVKYMDDLILFNYTEAAVYKNEWTWFETVSRGLILNKDTGEVVARPFDKFFNWGESGRYPIGTQVARITEKMDGSLGILYRHNGEYRIATRGSFTSQQALNATKLLQERYALGMLKDSLTLLFEIIYPENRIVVNYGNTRKLVLLAARDRFTGEYLEYDVLVAASNLFGFDVVPSYAFSDIDAVLATCPDIDHEGYVFEMTDGSRWKIKGDKYRKLHAIISHISFNHVLDAMIEGVWTEYRSVVPEEYWTEVDGYHAEINAFVSQTLDKLKLPAMTFESRKEFAQYITQTQPRELQRFFFNMLDNKFKPEDILKIVPRRSAFND